MTKIVVTVTKEQRDLPSGVSFAATAITVTDNAGNKLPAVSVNGTESPPWTAEFSGSEGPSEASAVLQDLDTSGNPIGDPVTLTESGTGGVVMPQFPATTGGTISVS
jgi:hypothetical protein